MKSVSADRGGKPKDPILKRRTPMIKQSSTCSAAMLFCGIDVQRSDAGGSRSNPKINRSNSGSSPTRPRGHWELVAWLQQRPVAGAGVAGGDQHLLAGPGSCPRRCCRHRGGGVEPWGGRASLRADPAAIQDRQGGRAGAGRVQSPHAVQAARRAPDRQALRLRTLSRHIEGLTWSSRRGAEQPAACRSGIVFHAPLRRPRT